MPDPHRYHQYVSADPTVHPQGTTLPVGTDLADADTVFAAVSALTRTPADALSQRGPARTLWLRSSRLFTTLSIAQIARETGLNRRTMELMDPRQDAGTRLVSRVLGDPALRRSGGRPPHRLAALGRLPEPAAAVAWANPGPP